MKVLLTQPIRPVGIEILSQETEVVVAPDRREETILSLASDFDAIITRTTMINKEILETGRKLKAVARHGAGVDLVDVSAATSLGIPVIHAPGSNSWSVAEFVVAAMLSLSRHLIVADYHLRIERRFDTRDQLLGSDLRGKTIGIIGMGNVGKSLARICGDGFGMKILGYDPLVPEEGFIACGVDKCIELENLLKESDFVSLHCPLLEETIGLIGEKEIGLMKPTAYLINFARGPVVQEEAITAALKEKKIAGAAFDVFWEEPPHPDCPFFDLPNVITTAHIAAFTRDSMDNMSTMVAKDILRVLRGERPLHVANPSVFDK